MISMLEQRLIPDHIITQIDLVRWAKNHKIIPRNTNSLNPPKIVDGEYLIPRKDKVKKQITNLVTGRLKNKKITTFLKTTIVPEDRTLKNLPRDSNKKAKVRFQDWLRLKNTSVSEHSVGQGANDKWYGWSHRAIRGFAVGDIIKPGHIGNKFEYGKEVDNKYSQLEKSKGLEAADDYINSLKKFTPYKIKTDAEALEHAIRFARDVS